MSINFFIAYVVAMALAGSSTKVLGSNPQAHFIINPLKVLVTPKREPLVKYVAFCISFIKCWILVGLSTNSKFIKI